MTGNWKKILYVATSDIHLKSFHIPYLKWLSEEGHMVEIAAENRGGLSIDFVHRTHWMPFPRKLGSIQNIKTFYRLRSLIEAGNYDLVHCHTPIPSALTRLAARKWRRKGGKLIYTAHGFHFYRGGPLKNWLLYYPAEWILSSFTDTIVTINKEDFGYAQDRMRNAKSFLIPGIGVDTDRFKPVSSGENRRVRHELGLADDDFILLYVAEFIPRKNHEFLIDALPELLKKIPNLKLLLAGRGILFEECKAQAGSKNLEDVVHFLGFRTDLPKLAAVTDVAVSSSRHEGLGLALVEQMLCEVPVIASEDRGHREFVTDGETGYLFAHGDKKAFQARVTELFNCRKLRDKLGKSAQHSALEFSIENSLEKMKHIYLEHLSD